jgi:cellulose synthase/poly-beta-1,6-N-acetylglucosamine synthase-like glycosyltransferase
LVLALIPAVLTLWNLYALREPAIDGGAVGLVSVLIPARNEAGNIETAIASVLASTNVNIDLIVLDDSSTDATAAILRAWEANDSRVRVINGATLPRGKCGKPYACQQLADTARGEILFFMDADVRLAPEAVSRIVGALLQSNAAMLSGIPKQTTATLAEKLVVPFLHLVLLGYLPIAVMRRRMEPAFGAACGQLIAVKRSAYMASGGHAAIATKVHDGIALARNFRVHGLRTDLVDVTQLATCRMYTSIREIVAGFAKNAHEGLGSPRGIVPWTLVIGGGQVLPTLLLPFLWSESAYRWPLLAALLVALLTRFCAAIRFRQDKSMILLHPLGAAVLLAIQWYALFRRSLGKPILWKQRDPTMT